MPEGPEIRRAADRIGKALVGRTVVDGRWPFPTLSDKTHLLLNQEVLEVTSKGKAMLIRLDNGWTMYSHNQLYGRWTVHLVGGKEPTDRELMDWAVEVEQRGAGEILFTSMDHDGTQDGFACSALATLSKRVSLPLIASGGAGTLDHFVDVFQKGKADAALAASVFHFGQIDLPTLKQYLIQHQLPIRI